MNVLRRLLDRLSVYLPLIAMGMLASASWWLVRSAPVLPPPASDKPVRQDPDYRLSDFSVKSFDATGRMTREVSGDQAQHDPASQTLNISHIRIQAQSETGATMNAQALQGIATDDGSRVTLIGDVYAIRHPHGTSAQIELRGQRMQALPDEDQLVSTDPVQITRDRDEFTALSMHFNSGTGEYELQGRVRGMLMPKTPP